MEKKNPVACIEMEQGSKIEIELYPESAPNTVANFVSLIKKSYYDGLTFHRVIPNFMIQGGCPQGTGMGGPGYCIFGEFSGNGFPNPLKHERGVISMARSMRPDSAGSQFFIMVAASPHLDGQYAAFGKVISGMENVDDIVHAKTDSQDKPIQPQIIKKISINCFEKELGEVKKI